MKMDSDCTLNAVSEQARTHGSEYLLAQARFYQHELQELLNIKYRRLLDIDEFSKAHYC